MKRCRIAIAFAIVLVALAIVLGISFSKNLKLKRLVDAVRHGDESTTKRILQSVPTAIDESFSFHGTRRPETLLQSACMNRQTNIVGILIERGADVNLSGEYGESPLHIAAGSDCLGCVKLLLEAGAEVNARAGIGRTPLMEAVRGGGDSDIIEMLLRSGADPRLVDALGETALQMATSSGQTNYVRILERVSLQK